MNICVDLISFVLEILSDLLVFSALFGVSPRKTHKPVLCCAIYFILGATLTHFLPDFFGWVLVSLLRLAIFRYIFSSSWFRILLADIPCIIFTLLIQNLFVLLAENMHLTDINAIAISGSIFTVITSWCIYRFATLHAFFSKFILGSKYAKFLLIHIYLILQIQLCISKYTHFDANATLPLICVFAVIIIITDIIILHQQLIIARQQHDIASYMTYQPMMSDLIDDIRGKQHDFNNEIAAIRMLPFTHKNYESLRDALINCSDMVISEYREADLLKINLTVLAGFIHSKIIQSEKTGKCINLTILEHTLKSQMPEYELIRVIGVLVDNALEAIRQGESISLHLDSKENKIIISTLNEGPELTQDLRQKMFTKGYTTKTADRTRHGQGLPNLKKLVEQYDGKIYMENSYSVDKTFIKVEVVV